MLPDNDAGQSSSPLGSLGWTNREQILFDDVARPGQRAGRVVRHDGTAVQVGTETGVATFGLRRALVPLAVGDWVAVDDEAVTDLLPRRSLLKRRDPSTGDAQPIAANIDTVGIVCGLDRPVALGRIQRFSTLAWDAGASPLIILSKADLVAEITSIEDEILTAVPGGDVIAVSALAVDGVADLLAACADKTIVLVGESGAGKSTLVNALADRAAAVTGEVRSGDHKGRHTTTSRELYVLDGRCRLIDTPGVREVGLFTDVATVDEGFAEIAEFAVHCRFADCGHDQEPGCAVRDAVDNAMISAQRLDAWKELRAEAASAELRADPAAAHRADRQQGRVYKEAQRMKRRNR